MKEKEAVRGLLSLHDVSVVVRATGSAGHGMMPAWAGAARTAQRTTTEVASVNRVRCRVSAWLRFRERQLGCAGLAWATRRADGRDGKRPGWASTEETKREGKWAEVENLAQTA
jgi:hypothetical protein